MRTYEITVKNGQGATFQQIYYEGVCGMDAAENAVAHGALHLPSKEVVNVIAVNANTGVAVIFEMARAE